MDLHNDFSISLLTWLRWLDGRYKYWIQAVNQTDGIRQDFAGPCGVLHPVSRIPF